MRDEALPGSLKARQYPNPSWWPWMTQELDVRPGQWVLELGTGTGYQTALLAYLVGETGKVFTIELQVAALGRGGEAAAWSDVGEERGVFYWGWVGGVAGG